MNQEIIVALSMQTFSIAAIQMALQKAQSAQCSLKLDLVYTDLHLLDRIVMSKRIQTSLDYAASLNIPVSILQKSTLIPSFRLDCEHHDVLMIYLDPKLTPPRSALHRISFLDQVKKHVSVPVDIFLTREMASFNKEKKASPTWADLFKVLGLTSLTTMFGLFLSSLGAQEYSIAPLYILNNMLCALVTSSMKWSVISTVISILNLNFFFAEPRFSLLAYSPEYPISLVVMILASLISGYLSSALSRETLEAQRLTNRTKALLETNQAIQQAADKDAAEKAMLEQLFFLFGWEALVFAPKEEGAFYRRQISRYHSVLPQFFPDSERQAVVWVWNNRKEAGAGREMYSNSPYLYFPVQNQKAIYGVLALYLDGKEITQEELGMIHSILYRAALTFENIQRAEQIAQTSLLYNTEQNRSTLLRAISHDLRTPITSILGNATNLVQNEQAFDPTTRRYIYQDMLDNSTWLANLVENLLTASKMENGQMEVQAQSDSVEELIEEALNWARKQYPDIRFEVVMDPDVILANFDHRLILQVLHHLIENAVIHNPKNKIVTIKTSLSDQEAIISVIDEGVGIPKEDRPNIYKMFYTGKEIADSTRSMGLGLYLCQSIVEAHQGRLWYEENQPSGSNFSFTVPTVGFSAL